MADAIVIRTRINGCLLLALLAIISVAFLANVSVGNATPTLEKGVVIGADFVVKGVKGAPSISDLQQAGFTLVGTNVYSYFKAYHWTKLRDWVQSAHAVGLKTFVNLGINLDPKTAIKTITSWTRRSASLGIDVVAFDELIQRYGVTEEQLHSIIDTGLQVNPDLQFIVNEFTYNNIKTAYQWTSDYASVRIATDDYYNTRTIDLGIQLSQQYGKEPLAWLIFSKSSQDFICYEYLDDWLAYAKDKQIDTLFWYIDTAGTWQMQWPKVVAY